MTLPTDSQYRSPIHPPPTPIHTQTMTVTADTTTSYHEELSTCPECDGLLRLVDGIESTGEGVAFGYVECNNCGFRAREEWVHDQTVRTDDQDAP